MGAWMPQIVRDMYPPGTPYWRIGLLSAIPSLVHHRRDPAMVAAFRPAAEKFWHCIGAV